MDPRLLVNEILTRMSEVQFAVTKLQELLMNTVSERDNLKAKLDKLEGAKNESAN